LNASPPVPTNVRLFLPGDVRNLSPPVVPLHPIHRVFGATSNSRTDPKYRFKSAAGRRDLLFDGFQASHTQSPFAVVPFAIFKRNFSALTRGVLDKLNWENVVCAGGSVLACLTHFDLEVCSNPLPIELNSFLETTFACGVSELGLGSLHCRARSSSQRAQSFANIE